MRNHTHQPTYAAWAQGAREVPDMLVAAQLSLRSLAKDDAVSTSAETRRIVGDACDLLRVALANLLDVTRGLPGFPLEDAGRVNGVGAQDDPRMSPRSHSFPVGVAAPPEQCALTRRFATPSHSLPGVTTPLTDEQLDRLRRCANGNTLRFESSDIVAALVAGGFATEGVGRVVTVTAKGHRYLKSHLA